MVAITQFHSSAVQPAELNRILDEYIALEHVRTFRQLLVRRFGLLSLAVLVIGMVFHWMSLGATACTVGLFVVPPVWAWVVEIRKDRALARRLERIPGVIRPPLQYTERHARFDPTKKVIKSS